MDLLAAKNEIGRLEAEIEKIGRMTLDCEAERQRLLLQNRDLLKAARNALSAYCMNVCLPPKHGPFCEEMGAFIQGRGPVPDYTEKRNDECTCPSNHVDVRCKFHGGHDSE